MSCFRCVQITYILSLLEEKEVTFQREKKDKGSFIMEEGEFKVL